jgi:hypothetical protein
VLQLTGYDATTTNATEIKAGAVSCVDSVETGAIYGTAPTWTYAAGSHSASVGVYTLGGVAPASGAVKFALVVTAPDGCTETLRSASIAAEVDATSVTLGAFATGLTLLGGTSISVPVTFVGATPASAEVASSGSFSSLATSVSAGSFAATYSGSTAAETTLTFIVSPTRRRLTATVAATGILVWPTSATTAHAGALTTGTAAAIVTTLSSSVPSVVTAALSALAAADASTGASIGTPTVSGNLVSYTLTPTASTAYTATVTLSAGAYAKVYAAQTLATAADVYAWPIVSAVLALNGATSGADHDVRGFAAGRAYGASSATSTVTLKLGGIDADTPNTTEVAATGAVSLYVGNALVVGGVAAYTYTGATHTVAVTSMALGSSTGALEFRVTVTAPSGTTRVISTSGHTAHAVPDTVSVATIAGGDAYALVAAHATATQFTFGRSRRAPRRARS